MDHTQTSSVSMNSQLS